MLSEVVSLTRLRFYERECRQQAGTATDSVSRAELSRFGETFQRAITRLESKLDDFEARRGTRAPLDCRDADHAGNDALSRELPLGARVGDALTLRQASARAKPVRLVPDKAAKASAADRSKRFQEKTGAKDWQRARSSR
jgi:hypothetical protein